MNQMMRRQRAGKTPAFLIVAPPPPLTFFVTQQPDSSSPAGTKPHRHRALTGYLTKVSLVPKEARRKPRNGASFDVREPGSPKITCLGEIKKKKKTKTKTKKVVQKKPPLKEGREPAAISLGSCFSEMILSLKGKSRQQIGNGKGEGRTQKQQQVPKKSRSIVTKTTEGGLGPSSSLGLGNVRRFASGRGGLQSFDWKIAVGVEITKLKDH